MKEFPIGLKVRATTNIRNNYFPSLNTDEGEIGEVVDYDELGPIVLFHGEEIPVETDEIEAVQ